MLRLFVLAAVGVILAVTAFAAPSQEAAASWTRAEIVNVVVAFGTLGYLAVSLAMWRAMRAANRVASQALTSAQAANSAALEQTSTSNELTARSVAVAEASLAFTRESFRVAHRPRLHVVKAEVLDGKQWNDTRIEVGVVVKNLGGMTAHNVVHGYAFHLRQAGEELEISQLPLPRPERAPSVGSIGPGAPTKLQRSYPLDTTMRDRLYRHEVRLYFAGVVQYSDDAGSAYTYRYAYFFDPNGKQFSVFREAHEEAPSNATTFDSAESPAT
jgi:hypothetical protein